MLVLKDVRKSYTEPGGGLLPILDIPHFQVSDREQMALVGRSGSGKTTLLHVIAGISAPDEGEVSIDGVDITKLPEAGRDRFRAERIGYVFQTFNLLPAFTALENVLLGMTFARGAARAGSRGRAAPAGWAGTSADAQARGTIRRRTAAGIRRPRELANRPSLLLADEPTANIDTGHQQQVIDLLRKTCGDENVSLVLVTHTPEVSSQFDRVDELHELNRAGSEETVNAVVTDQ